MTNVLLANDAELIEKSIRDLASTLMEILETLEIVKNTSKDKVVVAKVDPVLHELNDIMQDFNMLVNAKTVGSSAISLINDVQVARKPIFEALELCARDSKLNFVAKLVKKLQTNFDNQIKTTLEALRKTKGSSGNSGMKSSSSSSPQPKKWFFGGKK